MSNSEVIRSYTGDPGDSTQSPEEARELMAVFVMNSSYSSI
jgi:hypothetical protein